MIDTFELVSEFITTLRVFIGLNRCCSLETQTNLDVVKEIPLSSVLLEIDYLYCEIKPYKQISKEGKGLRRSLYWEIL